MAEKNKRETLEKHSCVNCGAEYTYKPGSTDLICAYCNHKEEIVLDKDKSIEEQKLDQYLSEMGSYANKEETISMIDCKSCGAHQHIEQNKKTMSCAFCASPLEIKDEYKEDWILPGAILPFQLDKNKAKKIFLNWANGLWFAPNNFKKASLQTDNINGIYTPYWTFDANMTVEYSGKRGEYYYVTEYRNVTVNGKTERRAQQVRKTRWYNASGVVDGFIDDTLVNASKQAKRKFPKKIMNWNLHKMVPYERKFLAGFITEKYTISLQNGHISAKEKAENIAHNWACRDIGGDTQRVNQLNKKLANETFKHILLPVYISNYKYAGKNYSFFINGDTGVLKGERPYSFWKIFLTILASILILVILLSLS